MADCPFCESQPCGGHEKDDERDDPRDCQERGRSAPAWEGLARDAAEANIFYESTWFIELMQRLGPEYPICCLFVYRPDPAAADGRRLIGFFPFLSTHKGPARANLKCYRLFDHVLVYLRTPLVHRDHVAETLDGLFDWIDSRPDGVRLFELYHLTGDGPVGVGISERFAARGQPHLIEKGIARAFFRPAADAEVFLADAISGKKRKEYRRQRRRLEDLGEVAVTVAGTDPDGSWTRRFLDMEATAIWRRPARR